MLEKFEIVKCEPMKFVGGSVYLQNKGKFRDTSWLWNNSDWIWEHLDAQNEFATQFTHKSALTTWEKYCDKNALHGYYIGKFMKPDCPVPHDYDWFDINCEYMAVGWVKGKLNDGKFGDLWAGSGLMGNAINASEYKGWGFIGAEAYTEPDENGDSWVVYYTPCELK